MNPKKNELEIFFKPTFARLLLFVIFFSVLVPFLYYDDGCKFRVCGQISENSRCPPLGPASIFGLWIMHLNRGNCITFSSVEQISMPFAILGLLAAYIAACGIIWLMLKLVWIKTKIPKN